MTPVGLSRESTLNATTSPVELSYAHDDCGPEGFPRELGRNPLPARKDGDPVNAVQILVPDAQGYRYLSITVGRDDMRGARTDVSHRRRRLR